MNYAASDETMVDLKLEIKGISDLEKTLERKLKRLDLEEALIFGAQPMLFAAKKNAPVDTGALRDSLTLEAESTGSKMTAIVYLGPDKRMMRWKVSDSGASELRIPVVYAAAQEFGTENGIKAKSYMRGALYSKTAEFYRYTGKSIIQQLGRK